MTNMTAPARKTQHLFYAELDAWRQQNNSLITSGYHVLTHSWTLCFSGLLGRPHNQTVNILSHLLGALFISALFIPFVFKATDIQHMLFEPSPGWPSLIFYTSAMLCLSGSATFHLSTYHSQSACHRLNSLDLVGIVCLITGTYWPFVYYAFLCQPQLWVCYDALVGCFAALAAVLVALPKYRGVAYRSRRTAVFLGLGFSGVVPIAHNILQNGYEGAARAFAFPALFGGAGFHVLGALLYCTGFPERYAPPGRFDILGSSHQLMHLCVLAGVYAHHHALKAAAQYRAGAGNCLMAS